MNVLSLEPRPLGRALALGDALLDHASVGGDVWLAASLVHEEAIVLGAGQRAGRVVERDACRAAGVRVERRVTAGTAARLAGRSLWLSVALPHVAAWVADASPRTLLNRNVRPLLGALRSLGLPAAYFGREHIALTKRPGPVLGFEARPDGAVLLEVAIGWDAPVALPPSLAAAPERAVDRLRGKEPCALGELARGLTIEVAGARLVDALVAGAERRAVSEVEVGPLAARPAVEHDDDPIPHGLAALAPRACPIGWIDAAASVGPARVWLGGDGLVPSFVRERVAAAVAEGRTPEVDDVPLEGVTLAELVAAGAAALAAAR